MNSKEFGLVAAQQLFQLQDLHYGFWEKGQPLSIELFQEAQNRYTSFLFKYIEEAISADKKCKILDVGCGTGITTKKLLEMGYRVDGLVPSPWMAQQARKYTEKYNDGTKGDIYECTLEDFPASDLKEKYRLVYFSESYQYVNMQKTFDVLNQILSDNGAIIIFDFFRRDRDAGKSPMGGGHSIDKFYEAVQKNAYKIDIDVDVTENLSPNLKLVHNIMVDRILPFCTSLDAFLLGRQRLLYGLVKFIFRKKLKKLQYKYSENRNEENFIKYKTYRLIVLSRRK